MSKFNKTTPVAPRPRGPIESIGNEEGRAPEPNEHVARKAKSELFLTAVSSFLGEQNFYEGANERTQRFAKLVREVTLTDPEWVARFLPWLRNEMNIRTAATVGLVEYVAAGGPDARKLVPKVIVRADEPGEALAYWKARGDGAKMPSLPMGFKRGLADTIERLYTERSALKYDLSSAAVRFGDVIALTHPKGNVALWRYLQDSRHSYARDTARTEGLPIITHDAWLMSVPMNERRGLLRRGEVARAGWTWERLGSWLPGGMDAEAWEFIIPSMGYMALLRNLRNFSDADISDAVVAKVVARLTDPEEVANSRQLPLRFYSAYRNTQDLRWQGALETALRLSLQNIPTFDGPGRTLVLVDCSGSMGAPMSSARGTGYRPTRESVATLFGAALAIRNPQVDLVAFADLSARVPVGKDVLRTAEAIEAANVGGGTDTWGALQKWANPDHARVIIITDEMFNGRGRPTRMPGGMIYTFNISGYSKGQLEETDKQVTFGGLTDACFRLIPLIEAKEKVGWPF